MKKKNIKTIIIVLGVFLVGYMVATLQHIAWQDSNDYYDYYLSFGEERNKQMQNTIYNLHYYKDGGHYSINPIGKGAVMYVDSSSVPLDKFINKKVKITGHWVLTTRILRDSRYAQSTFPSLDSAVNITNIELAQ